MTAIWLAIFLAPFVWAYSLICSGQKSDHRQRDTGINSQYGGPM